MRGEPSGNVAANGLSIARNIDAAGIRGETVVGGDPDVVALEQSRGLERRPRCGRSRVSTLPENRHASPAAPMPLSCAVASRAPSHNTVTDGSCFESNRQERVDGVAIRAPTGVVFRHGANRLHLGAPAIRAA